MRLRQANRRKSPIHYNLFRLEDSKQVLRTTSVALLGAFLLSGLSACTQHPIELSGIVRAQEYALGSRVGGQVAEALVEEGEGVPKGTPLVRLDDSKLLARREVLAHAVEAAQATYDDLKAGATPEQIQQARAELSGAEAQQRQALAGFRSEDIAAAQAQVDALQAKVDAAIKDAARMERLAAEGVVSESKRDAAVAKRDSLAGELAAAKENLAKLTKGLRPEEIEAAEAAVAARKAVLAHLAAGATENQLAAAEAKVKQAQAELARLQLDLADTQVVAPVSGVVEEILLQPGEIAAPGQPIVSLVATDDIWIDVYVPESALGWVKIGACLEVVSDSYPDKAFDAEVTFVSRQAEFTPRNIHTPEERVNQVYRVKLKPVSPPIELRAGMNVSAYLSR